MCSDLYQVPIWAVTPQNEPEFAAPWEACVYNKSFSNHFIQNYLGPVLRSICLYNIYNTSTFILSNRTNQPEVTNGITILLIFLKVSMTILG